MFIANPIYDAVFRYLMDDQRAAKIILATITGFDIEDVQLRPTEVPRGENGGFTVYRMDFAARVRTSSGSRLVLIEIQKAKFATDIMRFRRYLGMQYASEQNCQEIKDPMTGQAQKIAEPIFTIYFLGHRLEHIKSPIIRVSRKILDATTGEELNDREEFIEGLTHDSVVIQIPELKERRRSKLEQLLGLFDQAQADSINPHAMRIDEAGIPEEFRDVVRTLVRAHSHEELRDKMMMEDQVLSELEAMERRAVNSMARAQEECRLKLQAEARAEEERRQKEAALSEIKAALLDTAQVKLAWMRSLVDTGMSEADARKIVGLELRIGQPE